MQTWEFSYVSFLNCGPCHGLSGGQLDPRLVNVKFVGGEKQILGHVFPHSTLFAGRYYPTHARYSLIPSNVIVMGQTRF